MAELLTQQEIDNLLSGIGPVAEAAPEAGSESAERGKDIVTFDFRLPHRLSKNQLRTLQAIHESFGESFASHLLGRLQTTVTFNVLSVDQLFYSEFVLSIGNPSCIYIFRVVESEAYAILELSPQLVLAIIERMLGGSAATDKKPRLITRIEQNIIKKIIHRALADLQKAWQNIAPLTFALERYEVEGDFAQIAPASEIVLVTSMEISIDDEKYLMNLCFPTFALEDVLARMNVQQYKGVTSTQKDASWRQTMKHRVEQTCVGMTATLGTCSVTLRELMDLEEGDVIRTFLPTGTEAQASVGGRTKFWGVPGVSNGKKALRITKVAESGDQGAQNDGTGPHTHVNNA